MRDLLYPEHRPAEPDPVRRAQAAMQVPKPKRFYRDVTVAAQDGAFAIHLDGRPVRTPAKTVLTLPTAGAAGMVAAEWRAQGDTIEPAAMPATRIANSAAVGVAGSMAEVAAEIVRYAGSDLVCYRASEPEGLVALQAARWDPVLDWAHGALGARFILSAGIRHVEQPPASLAAIADVVARFDQPLRLAALSVMTTLTGSALIALAVAHGAMRAADAWAAAHADEDWNIGQWGADEEAQERRARRWAEMEAAAGLLGVG